jgi:hypothetical protein
MMTYVVHVSITYVRSVDTYGTVRYLYRDERVDGRGAPERGKKTIGNGGCSVTSRPRTYVFFQKCNTLILLFACYEL